MLRDVRDRLLGETVPPPVTIRGAIRDEREDGLLLGREDQARPRCMARLVEAVEVELIAKTVGGAQAFHDGRSRGAEDGRPYIDGVYAAAHVYARLAGLRELPAHAVYERAAWHCDCDQFAKNFTGCPRLPGSTACREVWKKWCLPSRTSSSAPAAWILSKVPGQWAPRRHARALIDHTCRRTLWSL